MTKVSYLEEVRPGVLSWLESVRCKDAGWGRWRYSTAMERPWALQASGIAIEILDLIGILKETPEPLKKEAVEFFNSCQDPADHLFKDPFETEALRAWTTHSWAQIWSQRHGSVLVALAALGATPKLPPAEAQFVDLTRNDGGAWASAQDWRNPWLTGEDWTRAILAFLRTPEGAGPEARAQLEPMFSFVETQLLDPATGFPMRLGCKDMPVGMAGLFKLMIGGYHAAKRPVPFAKQAIDATLALQLESGEFGGPRNMCMNWDAAFILFHLDRQLNCHHRSAEIAAAIARLADVLMAEYRKPDGGFAFCGETCLTVHHSMRICEKPEPISDMLGTMMCIKCLEYADKYLSSRTDLTPTSCTTAATDTRHPCMAEPGLRQGHEKTDWRGQWIWVDAKDKERNAYAMFRHRFRTTTKSTITVEITADSFYELHIDGKRIGRGPSRSHLEYYSFDRHEIQMDPGEHVIAVLVHHVGVINGTIMTGRPGLLVDVLGIGSDFGSGSAWRCRMADAWRCDLPCLMSHFGFWEDCDMRLLSANWTHIDYNDSGWSDSTVIGHPPCHPWIRLIEPDIPLPRQTAISVRAVSAAGTWIQGEVKEDDDAKRRVVAGGWIDGAATTGIPSKQAAARNRKAMEQTGQFPFLFSLPGDINAGVWLTLDFGRTVSGFPSLEIEVSESGAVLDLSYDDVTGAEGAVNPERTYARMTDRYVLATGTNKIRPIHPRGFRFITVDIRGSGILRLESVQTIETTFPFADSAGFFKSPDPELEGFATRAAETVRICTTDAFTDCASRERVQWMEDLYMHAKVAAYAFGETRLTRRALFQGAQNALPDGRINGFMPTERTNCAFASSSIMWLHTLADYRLFSGDDAGCRQLLPTARKLLEFIGAQSDVEGLIAGWPAGQFWDWSPIEDKGCLLLTNAAYAWALSRLGKQNFFRKSLGMDLEATAARIRYVAHRRFWDTERKIYMDAVPPVGQGPIFSQHANSFAVLSGICPEVERTDLLRRITDPKNLASVSIGEQSIGRVERPSPDKIVPAGTLWFGHFICQALFESGMAEEAIAQMRLLWGAYGDSPTFPETRRPAGNTTQCHGWAAGPAFLLPTYMPGAKPVNNLNSK